MKRRNFIKTGLGGGALFQLATPALAQGGTSMRMFATDAAQAEAFADRVNNATNGAMQINSEVVDVADGPALLDRVAGGEADMCLTSTSHFLEKDLSFGFFSNMPFGMSCGELESWVVASDGRDMLDMLGEENGVAFFLAADESSLPMWSKDAIGNLNDYLGKRIGSTGLGMRSLAAMGVSSVSNLHDPAVNWADLDVIDGVSAVEMQNRGLTGTFNKVMRTNPNCPSSTQVLAVSPDALAGLSDTHRLILDRSCSGALATSRSKSFHDNALIFQQLGDALAVADMPDAVWSAMNAASRSVLEDIFASGNNGASMVDAYVYFLTDIAGWSEIGEAAYYRGRKRIASL